MKVQPPYGSRVSILSRSQIPIAKNKKAELSLLMLEGCTAAAWRRIFAPQVVAFFFVWCSVTTWFQAGHFPRIRKTSPGATTSPLKSAKRSINFCQIPVKRKTLNIVDVLVPMSTCSGHVA